MKSLIKILPLFIFIACYKESQLIGPSFAEIKNLINIDTVKTALLADGESTTLINIYLPKNLKSGITTLKVTTSNGKFADSDSVIAPIFKSEDGRNIAQVELKASTKVEVHKIRVDVGPYFVTSKIESKPALPEYFETKLSKLKISVSKEESGSQNIETYPKRKIGKVSDGTEINIKVVDENGKDGWGMFLNNQNIFTNTGKLENTFYYLNDCGCDKLYVVYNLQPGQKPDKEKDVFFITK